MKNRTQIAAAAALAVAATAPGFVLAEDSPPPPYLMTDANTVTIAVTWDADSLDGILPEGVMPAEDLSGGLNVYDADGGYGLTPYSAAYAYVNVKGWNSSSNAPARFIIGGWYGPDPKVSKAMRTHFNADVKTGDASQSADNESWIGTGGDEAGTIKLVVKPSGDCIAAGGTLNYVGDPGGGEGYELMQIPFVGNYCPAEPVSVDISGPEGSALAQLKVDKMLAGGQLRDGTFAFTD